MKGRIVKQISNDYTVKADKLYVCKARGKFRNLNVVPLVGDEVLFSEDNYILDILPRKNKLYRPSISNIDEAIIITSLKEPDFSTVLLDKLLTIIEFNSIKPVIVFTKGDLLSPSEYDYLKKFIDYYKNLYDVYMNTEIDKIKKIFKGKVCVFTGQTGAGKSTLLNKINSNFNLKTGEISLALGRGKHTTRHTELLEVEGGLVADTPGFSALDFGDMTTSDIRDNFKEFNFYRDECKFRDCMHVSEKKCMVRDKVLDGTILKSRYDNYLKFIGR